MLSAFEAFCRRDTARALDLQALLVVTPRCSVAALPFGHYPRDTALKLIAPAATWAAAGISFPGGARHGTRIMRDCVEGWWSRQAD